MIYKIARPFLEHMYKLKYYSYSVYKTELMYTRILKDNQKGKYKSRLETLSIAVLV